MSNTVPVYEKVYLFITYRIGECQSDRFFDRESKEWNFYVHDIESYFNLNKVCLFIDYWSCQSGKGKNLKQIVDESFEIRVLNARLVLSRLLVAEKNRTLDLRKNKETVSSLLNGINYLNIKDCFKSFVNDVYAEYTKTDISFRNWEKIFYIENPEQNSIACAVNDYQSIDYQKEFVEYILEKLPKLFPANDYYVFIHGRYLINNLDGSYICEYPSKIEVAQIQCPKEFHIKSFHHTFSYLEYEFLISRQDFIYLNLELLFDSDVRKGVKIINDEIVAILDSPEYNHSEQHIDVLKKGLDYVRKSRKSEKIDDILFSIIIRLQNVERGDEIVNVINNMLEVSKLLKIR